MAITLRSSGSPLTNAQIDENFNWLASNASLTGEVTTNGNSATVASFATTVDCSVHTVKIGLGASSAAENASNIRIGSGLLSNTTGTNNTAVGMFCLDSNTTGVNNTAVGAYALRVNTTGSQNTSVGRMSLTTNTTGGSNVAVGQSALISNSAGSNNIAVGANALYRNTISGGSVAIGTDVLAYATTRVTTLGAIVGGSGYTPTASTTTYNGVSLSYSSGTSLSTSAVYPTANITVTNGVVTAVVLVTYGERFIDTNTVMTCLSSLIGGTGSGFTVAIGSLSSTIGCTAVGYQALNLTEIGINCTAVGYQALSKSTANSNTALGYAALKNTTTADANTAVGTSSLTTNTTGVNNTAVGYSSLSSNTVGTGNSSFGATALLQNTTAINNTAVGYAALYANTTGGHNIALGKQALYANVTGVSNTSIGANSLQVNTTGNNNIALGGSTLTDVLPTSKAITAFASYAATVSGTVKATSVAHGLSGTTNKTITGTVNYDGTYAVTVIDVDNFYFTDTFVATETGWWSVDTEGNGNTAVGYNTGRGITTGSNNTILGGNITGLAASLSDTVVIGSYGKERVRIDSSGNFGIGTTSPSTALHLYHATAASLRIDGDATTQIELRNNVTSAVGPSITLRKARGTTSTNTAVVAGDSCGDLNFSGYSGSSNINVASISGIVSAIASTTDVSGYLTIKTRPAAGSALVERMRIDPTGIVLIGTSTVSGTNTLQVSTDALINGVTVGLGATGVAGNTAIGVTALNANTTGVSATAVGFEALKSYTTGTSATAVGYQALKALTTGTQNTGIGYLALGALTTSSQNTGVGYASYLNLTSGSNNVGLGTHSGRYIADGSTSLTTADNCTYLGYQTKASANSITNEMAIGYNAVGLGSNTTVIGNSSTTATTIFGTVTTSSAISGSSFKVATGNIASATLTTSAVTASQVVDSNLTNTYRSVTYTIQITSGSSYHCCNINIIHDDTTAYMNQYGDIFTGSALATFDADVSSGSLRLLTTPTNAVTVYKVIKTLINI